MSSQPKNQEAPHPRRGSRRRPRRRKNNTPLKVSFADRLLPMMPKLAAPEPTPKPRPLPAPPPKPARDVLGVLLAATGLVLAARRNARVELLPGLPVTVVISTGREPAAAFVLPISEAEACKVFGKPAPVARDPIAELLYEAERQADLAQPDIELQNAESYIWCLEEADAGLC